MQDKTLNSHILTLDHSVELGPLVPFSDLSLLRKFNEVLGSLWNSFPENPYLYPSYLLISYLDVEPYLRHTRRLVRPYVTV